VEQPEESANVPTLSRSRLPDRNRTCICPRHAGPSVLDCRLEWTRCAAGDTTV